MDKVFKVADIRKFEQQVAKGEISYSRMVELMNKMAYEHYVKKSKESNFDLFFGLIKSQFTRKDK